MYRFKISTSRGKTVNFTPEFGIVADVDPLSGVDVDVSTSQGFQQLGETVESQSVSGITRTIKGVIFSNTEEVSMNLIRCLPVFTSGKLYFNDKHYCNIVVSKTPTVSKKKNGKVSFMMAVFCDSPFWHTLESVNYLFGGYEPAFSFPVCYSPTHTYGVILPNAFVNCKNDGGVDTYFSSRFVCAGESVTNFGLLNATTGENLRILDSLRYGDEVNVRYVDGILTIKKTSSGEETDIFSKLDETSTLFKLKIGDNPIKAFAETGEEALRASISFDLAEMGVIA